MNDKQACRTEYYRAEPEFQAAHSRGMETVKTVSIVPWRLVTPLERGVSKT